jgi:hypothetical protein
MRLIGKMFAEKWLSVSSGSLGVRQGSAEGGFIEGKG